MFLKGKALKIARAENMLMSFFAQSKVNFWDFREYLKIFVVFFLLFE